MKTILIKELKLNLKNFLIWSLVVGGMGFVCILLYQSMETEMADMADAFSNMGAFSDAFGMSTLSIASLKGFFATEVGTVHGLGSAMFASILAIGILSKEEEMHSAEFLLSLPVSRKKVVTAKGLCVLIMLVAFTAICTLLYCLAFVILGEGIETSIFITYMLRVLLMNIEIAGICFSVSAFSGKNRMGAGIGIALMFYVFDLMGRVVPDLKDYLFIGPFSFANASEIMSEIEPKASSFIVGIILTVLGVATAYWIYDKRDISS